MEDQTLVIFANRLKKLNINVEFMGNIPWIYLHTINGKRVTERFHAEHGFTVAFLNNGVKFTDIGEIFKVIRKYITK